MNITEAQQIVQRVADSLADEWPGIAAEDIAGAINEFLVKRWADITGRDLSEEQLKAVVYGFAKREGKAYCTAERYAFQSLSAEWIYTPKEVRTVLTEYFFHTGGDWVEPVKRPNRDEYLESDSVSIPVMDMKAAFESLSKKDAELIVRHYGYAESLNATDRKRLQRAVETITKFLNRGVLDRFDHSNHEGPGSRRAMKNSHARFITDEINEGGEYSYE